jgi:hypothetical protein
VDRDNDGVIGLVDAQIWTRPNLAAPLAHRRERYLTAKVR